MELATEYILGKVITLTDCIARRTLLKAGTITHDRLGGIEGNRTLADVIGAIEKETTQILDCLASQQQSKVDSAYQYIKFAMADLQAWNDEPHVSPPYHFPSTPSSYSTISSYSSSSSAAAGSSRHLSGDSSSTFVSPITVSSNFHISAPTQSKYFRDAVWQLRQADEWATEAFNDKRNSKSYVRIEALNIRLFCRALLDWDNKRLWFAKWRQVLEPFFNDRQFVRYCMGEQSFASKLFSDERAKPVLQRLIEMTTALTKLIWGMLLREPSLAPYAREFAIYFDKNTTLAPDVRRLENVWSGLRTFHLSYYDMSETIELKLCADRVVVRMYEFKSITPTTVGRGRGGPLWAVEHSGRLVSFDPKEPDAQQLVMGGEKRWLELGYASKPDRIYATAEDDSHISVFEGRTGALIGEERIEFPAGPTQAYAYRMRVTVDGVIVLSDKGSSKMWVRVPCGGNDSRGFVGDPSVDSGIGASRDLAGSFQAGSDGLIDGARRSPMVSSIDRRPDGSFGEPPLYPRLSTPASPPVDRRPPRSSGWIPLKSGGDYQAIIQGSDPHELIGLNLHGYYLDADVIRVASKTQNVSSGSAEEAMVVETIRERLQLPSEPQTSLVAASVDENVATDDLCCSDSVITIACQTDKLNYLISAGIKSTAGGKAGVEGFKIKDVCSFDTKYTDWKMAREMIETDGKLYMLFR